MCTFYPLLRWIQCINLVLALASTSVLNQHTILLQHTDGKYKYTIILFFILLFISYSYFYIVSYRCLVLFCHCNDQFPLGENKVGQIDVYPSIYWFMRVKCYPAENKVEAHIQQNRRAISKHPSIIKKPPAIWSRVSGTLSSANFAALRLTCEIPNKICLRELGDDTHG